MDKQVEEVIAKEEEVRKMGEYYKSFNALSKELDELKREEGSMFIEKSREDFVESVKDRILQQTGWESFPEWSEREGSDEEILEENRGENQGENRGENRGENQDLSNSWRNEFSNLIQKFLEISDILQKAISLQQTLSKTLFSAVRKNIDLTKVKEDFNQLNTLFFECKNEINHFSELSKMLDLAVDKCITAVDTTRE